MVYYTLLVCDFEFTTPYNYIYNIYIYIYIYILAGGGGGGGDKAPLASPFNTPM